MPGINLAPGTQLMLQARKRRRRLLTISALVVAVSVLTWLGMNFFLNQLEAQRADIATELRNVEVEIANLEEEARRIVLFERRLVVLDTLLNNHVTWNNLLQDLERLMPAETVLTELALTKAGGTASVRGLTTNVDQVALTFASLLSAPAHTTAFQSARLGNVEREETAGEEGNPAQVRYRFDAALSFDPSILRSAN